MNLDTMRWHASLCESLTMKDKAQQEEESKGDNGNEDDGYLLKEIYL